MKAISLWNPWASLMKAGAKKFETRNWPTSYRGDIAIHAGKVCDREFLLDDLVFKSLVGDAIKDGATADGYRMTLPAGAVLCVVEIYDCVPSTDADMLMALEENEAYFGDYSHGRFMWLTRNLRPLKEPVRCRGYQKIWTLDPEVERLVSEQL